MTGCWQQIVTAVGSFIGYRSGLFVVRIVGVYAMLVGRPSSAIMSVLQGVATGRSWVLQGHHERVAGRGHGS
jgi:hypothetical protein